MFDMTDIATKYPSSRRYPPKYLGSSTAVVVRAFRPRFAASVNEYALLTDFSPTPSLLSLASNVVDDSSRPLNIYSSQQESNPLVASPISTNIVNKETTNHECQNPSSEG